MGGSLKVKECSNGVRVPAGAEIVLEGYIGNEVTDEGPFVDITGTYDPVAPAGNRVYRYVYKTGFYLP